MRTILATFVIEQDYLDRGWQNVGTTTITREVEQLPVKMSWLKKEAQNGLPNHLRVKSLESISDITDIVEFDE